MKKLFTRKVEYLLPLLAILMAAIGVFNSYSATFYASRAGFPIFAKHALWAGLGTILMIIVAYMKENYLEELSYHLYLILIFLLILVLVLGKVTGGAKRWISLGFLNFQPSEIGKVIIILMVARYFSRRFTVTGFSLYEIVPPFLAVLVASFFIAFQPDLGTAGLYLIIFFALAFIACLRLRGILTILLSGMISIPLMWLVMKDYQKERILTFMSPEKDRFGAGYHVLQSKIAIGSGGMWGKGFLKGTQGQLRFLPEQHTDFAFSVMAEEWGFVICFVLMVIFLSFILRILYLSTQVQDRYSSFVISGIGIYFLFQAVINLSMVMGIFPVVGVPLPFFSYGGSSMITSMLAVGIVINQTKTRFLL